MFGLCLRQIGRPGAAEPRLAHPARGGRTDYRSVLSWEAPPRRHRTGGQIAPLRSAGRSYRPPQGRTTDISRTKRVEEERPSYHGLGTVVGLKTKEHGGPLTDVRFDYGRFPGDVPSAKHPSRE